MNYNIIMKAVECNSGGECTICTCVYDFAFVYIFIQCMVVLTHHVCTDQFCWMVL